MRLLGVPVLGKVSAILAVAAMFASLTGCPNSGSAGGTKPTVGVGVTVSHTTSSNGTSSTTVTLQGSINIPLISPVELGEATPQDAMLVDFVPQAFTYSTSDPAFATFTATTDTGYSSSFTAAIAECSTCYSGSVPSGYSAYPFEIASSSAGAWETWMAQVAANTEDNATIVVTPSVPTTSITASGTYTDTSSVVDSSGNTDASASTTYTVPPPPSNGCGGAGEVKCTDPGE